MNPDEEHAANIAHGAVVGRLNDPEFDPGQFVKAELTRLPPDERGAFLIRVAVAAVSQHAGTLVALQGLKLVDQTGAARSVDVDVIELMGRSADLRDETGPWQD